MIPDLRTFDFSSDEVRCINNKRFQIGSARVDNFRNLAQRNDKRSTVEFGDMVDVIRRAGITGDMTTVHGLEEDGVGRMSEEFGNHENDGVVCIVRFWRGRPNSKFSGSTGLTIQTMKSSGISSVGRMDFSSVSRFSGGGQTMTIANAKKTKENESTHMKVK